MTAADVLRAIQKAGATITVDGDGLLLRPSSAVTPILPYIVANKPEIIALLSMQATEETDKLIDIYDEQAHLNDALAAGCQRYVAMLGTIIEGGACIACGFPWERHGKPGDLAVRNVDDPDSRQLAGRDMLNRTSAHKV